MDTKVWTALKTEIEEIGEMGRILTIVTGAKVIGIAGIPNSI